MGLVIVFGSAMFPPEPSPAWRSYDALADPVGWVLVLLGTTALVRADPAFSSARWLALLAGAVSVPLWFPQVRVLLDDSAEWFASLPQVAFCLVLARTIGVRASEQRPADRYAATRCGLLVWGFALVAVLPLLVLGGGLTSLAGPAAVLVFAVDVALVYVLFRLHRRTWLGGPGPLAVEPRPRPEMREGRPPSS